MTSRTPPKRTRASKGDIALEEANSLKEELRIAKEAMKRTANSPQQSTSDSIIEQLAEATKVNNNAAPPAPLTPGPEVSVRERLVRIGLGSWGVSMLPTAE